MSQENVEFIVGVFEASNSGDFAAALDAHAEDATLAFHGELRHIAGDDISGKNAVGEWWGDFYRQFGWGYRCEIDESHDLGDRVLIVGTDYGQGRTSGTPITREFGYIFTIANGRIVRCDVYPSRAETLEAAGLRE